MNLFFTQENRLVFNTREIKNYSNLDDNNNPSDKVYKRTEKIEEKEYNIESTEPLKKELKNIYGDQDVTVNMIASNKYSSVRTFKLVIGDRTEYVVSEHDYREAGKSPVDLFSDALKRNKDQLVDRNELLTKSDNVLNKLSENSDARNFFEKNPLLLGGLTKYFPNISNIDFSISDNNWRNPHEDSKAEGSLYKIEKGEITIDYRKAGRNKRLIFKSNVRISNTKESADKESLYRTLVTNLLENRKSATPVTEKAEKSTSNIEKKKDILPLSITRTPDADIAFRKLTENPLLERQYYLLNSYFASKNDINRVGIRRHSLDYSNVHFTVFYKNGTFEEIELNKDRVKIVNKFKY